MRNGQISIKKISQDQKQVIDSNRLEKKIES